MGEVLAITAALVVAAVGVGVLLRVDLGDRLVALLGPPKTDSVNVVRKVWQPPRWLYVALAFLATLTAVVDAIRHRTTGVDIFVAVTSTLAAVVAFQGRLRGHHRSAPAPPSAPEA